MNIKDIYGKIENSEKIRLIKQSNDLNFIRECVIDEKGWPAIELIIEMRRFINLNDKQSRKEYINFVKECIKDKKLFFSDLHIYKLMSEIANLVNSKDEDSKEEYINFIKECIKDEEISIRLSSVSKLDLILKIKKYANLSDKENLKEYINFIKDKQVGLTIIHQGDIILDAKELIPSDDIELSRECFEILKKIVINEDQKLYVNVQYIKEMKDFISIDDKETLEDYKEFVKNYIEELKEYIENGALRRKDKIEKIVIGTSLINQEDQESVQDYQDFIEKFKKSNKLYLSREDLRILDIIQGDKENINRKLKINIPAILDTKINLPEGMTIGIEIESEGEVGKRLINGNVLGWIAKVDCTIDGVEITSPILKGVNKDSKEIYQVCGILKKIGQRITKRCGGHIHIGADYLKSKEAFANLLEIWGNTEKVLYKISNGVGETPRESAVQEYAPPISKKIQNAIEAGALDLNSEDDLEKFKEQIKNMQGNNIRYSGINFRNINRKMNTIEFRLSNGTLNSRTWIENINLFGRNSKSFTGISRHFRKKSRISNRK